MLQRLHFILKQRRPGGMSWQEQATSREVEAGGCAPLLQPGPMGNGGVRGFICNIADKAPWAFILPLTPGSMGELAVIAYFIGILSPIPLRPTLWDNHRSLWLLSAGYPFATLIFKAIVTSRPVGNTVMSQPALKCNLLFHRHSKTNVSKYYLFDELYCFQSWSCLYCCGFAFR